MSTRQSVVTKTTSKTKLVFYSLPPKYISSLKFPLSINISLFRYSVAPTKNLRVMLIPPLLPMSNHQQFLSILIMRHLVDLFSPLISTVTFIAQWSPSHSVSCLTGFPTIGELSFKEQI